MPPVLVRQLLRRLGAIAVILSVMLSTLGAAYASCGDMGGAPARTAMADMPGMAGHGGDDGSSPASDCEHAPKAPAGSHTGGTSCMLVAHCGTMMLVADADFTLAAATFEHGRMPAADASPHERPLEPDSPPPRA